MVNGTETIKYGLIQNMVNGTETIKYFNGTESLVTLVQIAPFIVLTSYKK